MLKLIRCELFKMRRKPLIFASVILSAWIPLAYAVLLANPQTSAEAVEGMMSCLFQVSAYLLLMPLVVILASNLLFEEQDHDTLKNLMTIPVSKAALAIAKMLILLIFSVLFMAAGGLSSLLIVRIQGWEPVGSAKLFLVGLGEGVMMWVGAMPCILLVVALNKSYIISVIMTFFYTMANYLLAANESFLMQPLGLNLGTLLPGPFSFRWIYPFYDLSDPSPELAELLERISPYFVSSIQAFSVIAFEGIVFLTLIAVVYKRQKLS